MSSVNKVILIGALGADPEVRSFQNGGKVANLRLATSERWKDKDGERQERTTWHTVAIFGDGLAGIAEKYLRKGSKVYLEGKLAVRKWTDKDGNDRYSTEVHLQGPGASLVMLGDPQSGSRTSGGSRSNDDDDGWKGGGSRRSPPSRGFDDGGASSGWGGGGFDDDLSDDVPF